LVVSVKSPVRARARAKAESAGVADGEVCVVLETPVTTTALGKVMEVGGDAEVGVDGLRR
jgi:hypothetical protein